MAYLAINSKFTPYTFDELVKPFVMYDTAYQQERTRTDELLEKAALLEDLSPTVDKETYDAYQEWKNQLKAVSDQMADSGLNNETRRTITSLGNTYRADYLPTIAKLKTRGALIKEQREYLQKHPNAFFDTDYSNTPVNQISDSSTYRTYDLDDITSKVMTDAYGKLANGETPNAAEYMIQYGSGVEDRGRQEQIARAINSGMSIASANNKQKELENYLRELQVKRSYSRGSGSGSGTGVSYTPGGVPKRDFDVTLPTGDIMSVKYNKKTGNFEYKDKSKKKTFSTTNPNESELLKNYYGGYYGTIKVGNTQVERILSDNTYTIRDKNGNWVSLPEAGDTSFEDFLNIYNARKEGKEIAWPIENELSSSPNKWDSHYETNQNRYTEHHVTLDNISSLLNSNYGELQNVASKLKALKTAGALGRGTEVVYYTDKRNKDNYGNEAMVFFKTNIEHLKGSDNHDIWRGSYIEPDWEDGIAAIRAIEENGGEFTE